MLEQRHALRARLLRAYPAWVLLLASLGHALWSEPATAKAAEGFASAGSRRGSARALELQRMPLFAPDGVGLPKRAKLTTWSLPWPTAHETAFVWLAHDYGPAPRFGIVRHEVDARVGLLRSYWEGRFATALVMRANVLAPEAVPQLADGSQLEPTQAVMLEAVAALDLRDRQRDPRQGVYVRLSLQEAGLGGLSSWDYFRAVAELRGYLPLRPRLVLAGRLVVGSLRVFRTHGLNPQGTYDVDELGPLSEQLQGGGATSHRGFRRGGLGAVRRPVRVRGAQDDTGDPYRSALITGGTQRWEGTLELRFALSRGLGAVLFADVGDVSRGAGLDLTALNFAGGFGLRKRTSFGMLRLEWAFRPDVLQQVGRGAKSEHRPCTDERDTECRPAPLLFGVPGAFHLSIAEPF